MVQKPGLNRNTNTYIISLASQGPKTGKGRGSLPSFYLIQWLGQGREGCGSLLSFYFIQWLEQGREGVRVFLLLLHLPQQGHFTAKDGCKH